MNIDLNQHILCEASAGTGKTYTIEQLYIRRLLCPMPNGITPKASQIAVLTFTKAVAEELAIRLKRALDKAIEEKKDARLEEAREEIDFAFIGTIHSFCYRTLSEYATGANEPSESQWATMLDIRNAIVDFFREGLPEDLCARRELKIVLQEAKHDFSTLVNSIMQGLWKDEKKEIRSTQALYDSLNDVAIGDLTQEQVAAELDRASLSFKGLRSREGELKSEFVACFRAFAKIFSPTFCYEDLADLIEYPLIASKLFSERKVKADQFEFLAVDAAFQLEPVLRELANPLKRLTKSCRLFVKRRLEEKGHYLREALIEQMEAALSDKGFVDYLRKRFSCLIVDEFQDTDPRQWKIMSELFLTDWKGYLYLVGDPKQAIYSFRSADLYCYMQAKELPGQALMTLTTNYRSSQALVKALNLLFCGEHTKRLFYLPKVKKSLDVPEVSCNGAEANLEGDGKGAVHFFVAHGALGRRKMWPTEELESDFLFPYIAHESLQLKKQGIALKNMAILIKDRHQAARLEAYLSERGLPAICWKGKSVVESEAHHLLCRLVKALIVPKDRSQLLELVTHAPFSYSSDAILRLEDLEFLAEHVEHLLYLRACFEKWGLAGLVQHFLSSKWPRSHTVKELLWGQRQVVRDLQFLVELAAGKEKNLELLQEFLFELSALPDFEKEQLAIRQDMEQEALQIMTLYASKGLEFEVVFALALASRTQDHDHEEPEELDAEKVRQLYVACTRAKRRLYLPYVVQEDPKPLAVGTRSPMELFFASFEEARPLESLIERSQGTITQEQALLDRARDKLSENQQLTSLPLFLEPLAFTKAPYIVDSFTSLKEPVATASKGDAAPKLPLGIESGILLHKLLKESLKQKEGIICLKSRLQGTPFEEVVEEVAKLLKSACEVPLGSFSLADVEQTRMLCEQEFYLEVSEGKFYRGQLDLVFEHQGAAYLLDWKSNYLEDYSEEALQIEIQRQHYDLQARMYTMAWKKQAPDLPFGGFFFVFLRALETAGQGVYRYDG